MIEPIVLTEEEIAIIKHALHLRGFLEYLTGLESDLTEEYLHLFETTKADSECPPLKKHPNILLDKILKAIEESKKYDKFEEKINQRISEASKNSHTKNLSQ